MNDFWLGRPVLVTGASGFIGSWLTAAIVRLGASVTATTRRVEDNAGPIRWLAGSIRDEEFVEFAFAQSRPAIVFHLAAQSLANLSHADPAFTLETNVRGAWVLLETSRRYGVEGVILSSSGLVSGTSAEEDSHGSHSPYVTSRSCAEAIARMYACSFGVPAMTLRLSNVFGGGDTNYSRLIPGVIRSSLRGEPFVIRSDGKGVRDLLYIEDAVDAFLCGAERVCLDPSLSGHAFPIASGAQWTVLEITEMILSVLGCSHIRPIVRNETGHERPQPPLDIALAGERLGWRPQVKLTDGLRRTADWYRRHMESERPAVRASAAGGLV